MYIINPIDVVVVKYFVTNNWKFSLFMKYVNVVGIASTAEANITGITPAEFNLSGHKIKSLCISLCCLLLMICMLLLTLMALLL